MGLMTPMGKWPNVAVSWVATYPVIIKIKAECKTRSYLPLWHLAHSPEVHSPFSALIGLLFWFHVILTRMTWLDDQLIFKSNTEKQDIFKHLNLVWNSVQSGVRTSNSVQYPSLCVMKLQIPDQNLRSMGLICLYLAVEIWCPFNWDSFQLICFLNRELSSWCFWR